MLRSAACRGGPASRLARAADASPFWSPSLAPQSTLASELPPGVLHQDAAFERLEQGPAGVALHFAGGRPPLTARLVVGADGGQSRVRQQVLGDGPPLYIGEAYMRERPPLGAEPTTAAAAAGTSTGAWYRHPPAPDSRTAAGRVDTPAGTAIWRAVTPPPASWPAEPGARYAFGAPPTMFIAAALQDGSVSWQVGRLRDWRRGGRRGWEARSGGSERKVRTVMCRLPSLGSPASSGP